MTLQRCSQFRPLAFECRLGPGPTVVRIDAKGARLDTFRRTRRAARPN